MLFFVQLVFDLSFCRFSKSDLDYLLALLFPISSTARELLETVISPTPEIGTFSTNPFMVKIVNGQGFSQESKEIGKVLQKHADQGRGKPDVKRVALRGFLLILSLFCSLIVQTRRSESALAERLVPCSGTCNQISILRMT